MLIGDGANNVIDGGPGNDTLVRGAGDDRFVFRPGWGNDTVADIFGSDTLDFTAISTSLTSTISVAGIQVVDGLGDTLTHSGNAIEFLLSGSGDDTIQVADNTGLGCDGGRRHRQRYLDLHR